MAGKTILILGGARSGKSRYAVTLASRLGGQVLFLATAEARDTEMRARIAAHRLERPAAWRTIEAATGLGAAIRAQSGADTIIIDCVTLWVANVLGDLDGGPEAVERAGQALRQETASLISAIKDSAAAFIIVSNEVGLGLVPETPLGRLYRDALGQVNQELARGCEQVYFMVSGIPWPIKGGETAR